MKNNICGASDIFKGIIETEGGYVNHPDDKGGPTCWGITETSARAHGYNGDMRSLMKAQAMDIYLADYWAGPRFDEVAGISEALAVELCDTGVNVGPALSTVIFQRWLTAFNDQGKLYPDLLPDGAIGPRTINALKAFLAKRGSEGEMVLLRALNCSQGQHYLDITEKREQNESFLYGWMLQRVQV